MPNGEEKGLLGAVASILAEEDERILKELNNLANRKSVRSAFAILPVVTPVTRYLPEGGTMESGDPTSLYDAYYRTAFDRLRVKYQGDYMKWGPRINMIQLRLARWLLWRDRAHFDQSDYTEALEELDSNIGFSVRLDVYDKYGV